jgi:hypothetical protein
MYKNKEYTEKKKIARKWMREEVFNEILFFVCKFTGLFPLWASPCLWVTDRQNIDVHEVDLQIGGDWERQWGFINIPFCYADAVSKCPKRNRWTHCRCLHNFLCYLATSHGGMSAVVALELSLLLP